MVIDIDPAAPARLLRVLARTEPTTDLMYCSVAVAMNSAQAADGPLGSDCS